jgi:signal transduction protein with GAF and PtsI domain
VRAAVQRHPAERFLEYFDGFSIGSNDLTQLTLGVDRDSGGPIASTFDERDDAVKAMLALAIKACQKQGKYVGICGQGPVGPSRSRAVAGGAGHREHVAQSRYGGRDVACARGREAEVGRPKG